jgi:hypothetical protein
VVQVEAEGNELAEFRGKLGEFAAAISIHDPLTALLGIISLNYL